MIWENVRRCILLACLALSASASAETVTFDRSNRTITADMRVLPVHVGGRVKIEPLPAPLPRGARSYLQSWPGQYFEAAFKGDRLLLKFDDEANEYRLLIDDRPPITLPQPGRTEVTIANLAPGRHSVRLEKVTYELPRIRAFQGFYVPADETALPAPKPRRRQIEFIGDSTMEGFGDRSPTTQCTDEEIQLRTDTQRAYPALVAKHFDADYQVNAMGGHGLIRNVGGFGYEHTIPVVYPYVLVNKTVPYADARWRPQIIVIKLNADLVGALQKGEKWSRSQDLWADYVKAYGEFVAELHRRVPKAAFLIWWFDTASIADLNNAMTLDTGRHAITDAAHRAGIPSIDFLPIKDLGFDRSACGGHPSLADHRKTAAWLTDYLDAHRGLWQGR